MTQLDTAGAGKNSNINVTKHIIILMVVAAVVRIVFSFFYTPKHWPPTYLYQELAEQFLSGDYSGYIGRLTPVYSFLMIATGFNYGVLALVQKLTALVVTVLIYFLLRDITHSNKVAFVSALAYTLNPSQWLFEASFLPEQLTTFFLILVTFIALRLLDKGSRPVWWKYAALGVLTALCLLTRPHYQFLPVLLICFTFWRLRKESRLQLTACLLSLIVPIALLTGTWLKFQYDRIGKAVLTNHAGITLMYHPVNFIEYAPEEYSVPMEIIQDGIREYLRKGSSHYGVVEAVIPEIQEKTGLTFSEVDSMYHAMAISTIRAAPHMYLKSVVKAGARFFKPSWYSRQFGIKSVVGGEHAASKVIAIGYSAVHMILVATLLLFPVAWLIYKPFRLPEFEGVKALFICFLLFLAFSIQAVMVLGENSRFRVSVEPLIYGISIWCLWRFYEVIAKKHRDGKNQPGSIYERGTVTLETEGQ